MRDFLRRLGAGGKAHEGDEARPSARERGMMRRRLRRQQRVREALLLDLGALVYELHRLGRREPELLQAKATEVSGVDREVRALAEALGMEQSGPQLLATGILGSCHSCGELLATDARFCPSCGTPSEPALAAEHEPSDEVPAELHEPPSDQVPAELHEMAAGERAALGGGHDVRSGGDGAPPAREGRGGGWSDALRRGRRWLRARRER